MSVGRRFVLARGWVMLVCLSTVLVAALAAGSIADAASNNKKPSVKITTVPSIPTVNVPYTVNVSGYSGNFKDLFLLTAVSNAGCGKDPGGEYGSNVNKPYGNAYSVHVKKHHTFKASFPDEVSLSGSQLICGYLTLNSKPAFNGFTYRWGKTFVKKHPLTVNPG